MKTDYKIKISVIIPMYNSEKYIDDMISSLREQTFNSFEVLIIDDGSDDNSASIAKKATIDSRFKYIYQNNAGAGAARNRGMELAIGEYLLFLDADDICSHTMLEAMFDATSGGSVDIVICNADGFADDVRNQVRKYNSHRGLPNGYVGHDEISKCLFQSIDGHAWDKLFRSKFIEKHRIQFQNLHHSNDNFFVYNAMALADKIALIDNVLIHHRLGGGTSLRDTAVSFPLCDLESFDAIRQSLQVNKLMHGKLKKSFDNIVVVIVTSSIIGFASTSRDALAQFYSAYFDKYETKWQLEDLNILYINNKIRYIIYKIIKGLDVDSIVKACEGSEWNRSKGNRNAYNKSRTIMRLAITWIRCMINKSFDID